MAGDRTGPAVRLLNARGSAEPPGVLLHYTSLEAMSHIRGPFNDQPTPRVQHPAERAGLPSSSARLSPAARRLIGAPACRCGAPVIGASLRRPAWLSTGPSFPQLPSRTGWRARRQGSQGPGGQWLPHSRAGSPRAPEQAPRSIPRARPKSLADRTPGRTPTLPDGAARGRAPDRTLPSAPSRTPSPSLSSPTREPRADARSQTPSVIKASECRRRPNTAASVACLGWGCLDVPRPEPAQHSAPQSAEQIRSCRCDRPPGPVATERPPMGS